MEPLLIEDDDRASEAWWIERARRGDRDAFERLYRRYERQVYGVCRRLLDTDQDAEDMTQRVFLRAWRRLDGFRGDSPLGAWLRQITVRLVIDTRRAGWRRELDVTAQEEELDPAPRRRSSVAAIDLERAVALLAAGPRRVLVLHDVEGYTHHEIATMLGVTVGTTKTQLFRARRALKESLR